MPEIDGTNIRKEMIEGQVCERSEVRLGLEGRGLDPGKLEQVKPRQDQRGNWGREVFRGCLSENDICGL